MHITHNLYVWLVLPEYRNRQRKTNSNYSDIFISYHMKHFRFGMSKLDITDRMDIFHCFLTFYRPGNKLISKMTLTMVHTHLALPKQVSWHRFHIHLRLSAVVRVGVGGKSHLSTAALMRTNASKVIGGLGWRLPWFPSPISAADLPLAMPGRGTQRRFNHAAQTPV